MPVRSQGKLLAGFAILCSISLISTSCQTSSPPRSSSRGARPAPSAPPAEQVRYSNGPLTRGQAPQAPYRPQMVQAQAPTYRPPGYDQPVIAASAWQPVQASTPPQRMPLGGPELESSSPLGPPRVVPMPADNTLPPSGQPALGEPAIQPIQPYFPSQLPADPAQPFTSAQRKGKKHGRTQFASIAQPSDDKKSSARDEDKDTLPRPRRESPPPPPPPNADPRPQVPYNVAAFTANPDVPREFQKTPLPPYVVEPPDILLIRATAAITDLTQPLNGQFLVRPDGSIGLGVYGSLLVAGKTIDQVRQMVAVALQARSEKLTLAKITAELEVDVLAYNSKYYYVITSGAGWGEQVYPFLSTGNETVLDAIAKINGLPPVSSKKRIWLARATLDPMNPKILPIDWCGITKRGNGLTNYQVFPGDRIYVAADPWVAGDTYLSKRLSPILRLFGATLLGASTVNVIKSGSATGAGGAGVIR